MYIYVCVHLFGCQNKSTCFQKLKSSNVFYAREWQMMLVAVGPPQKLATKRLVYIMHDDIMLVHTCTAHVYYRPVQFCDSY